MESSVLTVFVGGPRVDAYTALFSLENGALRPKRIIPREENCDFAETRRGPTPLRGEKKRKLLALVKRFVGNSKNLVLLDEKGMPPEAIMEGLYLKIERSYNLRSLETRGMLFRAETVDEKSAVRAVDGSLGWESLFTRGLDIIPVVGDHHSMMRMNNSALAQGINEALLQNWPD